MDGLPAQRRLISFLAEDKWETEFIAQSGSGSTTGLAGRTVYVDENNNGHFDTGEPSAVTDANGNFDITNIPVGDGGNYGVSEVVPSGWQQVSPVNPTYYDAPVTEGQNATGIDFITDPDSTTGPGTSGLMITQQPTQTGGSSTTVDLSIVAEEGGSAAEITYDWSVLGNSPAAVAYSDNNDATAADTTATFSANGTYTFKVVVTDGGVSIDSQYITAIVTGASTGDPLAIRDPAAALPSIVTGTTTILAALGEEGGSDAGLTYIWSAVGTPAAPVTLSDNEDNSAKNTMATFAAAGTYVFEVTVTDGTSLITSNEVTVVVQPALASIAVIPGVALVPVSTTGDPSTQQFSVQAVDQFGNPITGTPAVVWSDASGSPIDSSSGLYTAPTSGSTDTITATDGTASGTATVGLLGSANPAVTAVGVDEGEIDLSWAGNSKGSGVFDTRFKLR